jgi:hypothetical protein
MVNLDPKLGRTDRIINGVVGAALVMFALLGSFDKMPLRVVLVAVSVVFIFGGFGGT